MPFILKTKPFEVDFLNLSFNEQKQVLKTLQFLAADPRHPSLKTHKMQGTSFFEAYVNTDLRIIFERTSDTVVLRAVGHHDILRNY